MRPSWKCLLIVVVVALSSVASQADAQWWGGYRSAAWGCCGYTPSYSCYSPCYTAVSCYSPCYDTCGWYLGCRPGPIRRALFGPYRSYWAGSYAGCCYTAGCYTGGCGVTYEGCCGSSTAAPAAGPTPAPGQTPTPAKKPIAEPAMPGEPAAPTPPAPAEPAAPAAPKTTGMSAEESGILTVWVPYDAKVSINGMETRKAGSRRQFVSYGLKPGLSYKYVVKAQLVRNGQMQEDVRTIVLTAGEVTAVAFGFNVSAAQQVASAQ
jgi:uncharacterized protein (TIGR03000 family)